ncbi:hypothetical protein GIB67_040858 [Kingdonia uniflora]|uniref:Uncharacterized protein n=1 Tax=Kingdonia uniflora TaxID=39325 RepID=A0A7J7L7W5_9MAGN|nr:hypothetical protein GIB67_040858 [Kingdonia uniflora]
MIRSIRPITENYNIALPYTPSPEGRLLSQSIRPGQGTLYSYSSFNISHYGRLLIRSIQPLTETYNIALPVCTLSRGSLID